MSENWKDVPGYEGAYEVSDAGRVRSLLSNRILKPYKTNNGRNIVSLYKDGLRQRFLVYRLVLITFVGHPDEGQVACHNDGDRTNDQLSNLRWDSQSRNCADKEDHGTAQVGERHGRAILKDSDVIEMRRMYANGYRQTEIARKFNYCISNLGRILRRESWKHV